MSFKEFLIDSGRFVGVLLIGIVIFIFGAGVWFVMGLNMITLVIGLIIMVLGLLVVGYARFKIGGELNRKYRP